MIVTEKNIRFKSSRSSAPGGQRTNRRSTRIQMWVRIKDLPISEDEKKLIRKKLDKYINEEDELQVESEEERFMIRNKERALEKINELIRGALKTKPKRVLTKPSYGTIMKEIRRKHLRYEKKKNRRESKDILKIDNLN